MKTLKQFVETKKEPSQPIEESVTVDTLEAEDHIDLSELAAMDAYISPHDPPPVLLMRRKSIRMFPNGERVALYYVDKINKYVTVPYLPASTWSNKVREETLEENIIHHLKHIVDNHSAKTVKFKDGKSMKVDVQTANAVLKVHGALNDENKKKISDMAHKSKEHFGKVVDFAWKHLKFKD